MVGKLVLVPASGDDHTELGEELKLKMLEQRKRLDCHDIEELVDRSLFVQETGTDGYSLHSLRARVLLINLDWTT